MTCWPLHLDVWRPYFLLAGTLGSLETRQVSRWPELAAGTVWLLPAPTVGREGGQASPGDARAQVCLGETRPLLPRGQALRGLRAGVPAGPGAGASCSQELLPREVDDPPHRRLPGTRGRRGPGAACGVREGSARAARGWQSTGHVLVLGALNEPTNEQTAESLAAPAASGTVTGGPSPGLFWARVDGGQRHVLQPRPQPAEHSQTLPHLCPRVPGTGDLSMHTEYQGQYF